MTTDKEPEKTSPEPVEPAHEAELEAEEPELAQEAPGDAIGEPGEGEETGPDSEAGELMSRLEEAEARAADMQNKALRALAELENYRKRMARERQELLKSAAADVIESLLPALDNLRLGLQAAENHPEAGDVARGFEMVGKQMLSALQEQGLQELDPTGEDFDPHRHDSLSTQPSDEVEEGKVLQTIKFGYLLNDKLLRPATVIVSSGPQPS